MDVSCSIPSHKCVSHPPRLRFFLFFHFHSPHPTYGAAASSPPPPPPLRKRHAPDGQFPRPSPDFSSRSTTTRHSVASPSLVLCCFASFRVREWEWQKYAGDAFLCHGAPVVSPPPPPRSMCVRFASPLEQEGVTFLRWRQWRGAPWHRPCDRGPHSFDGEAASGGAASKGADGC